MAPVEAPTDLFDEHGLLTGEVGRRVWGQLCLNIEADIDEGGWDQPARLFAVSNPVNTEAGAGSEIIDAVRAAARRSIAEEEPVPDDAFVLDGIAFSVGMLGPVEGHPVQQLWGETAPGWADALLLSFEGWVVPILYDDDGQPLPDEYGHLQNRDHPRRLEVRQVLMLTRSGVEYAVARERGSDPRVVDSPPGGLLVEVLQRVLGLPTDPPPTTVADWLGRVALAGALQSFDAMLGRGPTGDLPAEVAAGTAQVQASLAALAEPDRRQMLTGIFARTFLAAVGHTAWKATEHGEVGVPRPLRRPLRDLAYKGARAPEHLEALERATEAAAGRSFADVVDGKRMRDLLPPEVAAAPAGWADEGILARRLCWREWASQPQLLEEVADRLGAVPSLVTDLLEGVGWASDAPAGPEGLERPQD